MSPSKECAVLYKKKIKEGSAHAIAIPFGSEKLSGFVVRKNNRFYAYHNECRHLPVTLDLQDGKLLSHDGKSLQCRAHGALYQIETGLCTEGPCESKSLRPLEVIEEEDRLIIRIPETLLNELKKRSPRASE